MLNVFILRENGDKVNEAVIDVEDLLNHFRYLEGLNIEGEIVVDAA